MSLSLHFLQKVVVISDLFSFSPTTEQYPVSGSLKRSAGREAGLAAGGLAVSWSIYDKKQLKRRLPGFHSTMARVRLKLYTNLSSIPLTRWGRVPTEIAGCKGTHSAFCLTWSRSVLVWWCLYRDALEVNIIAFVSNKSFFCCAFCPIHSCPPAILLTLLFPSFHTFFFTLCLHI